MKNSIKKETILVADGNLPNSDTFVNTLEKEYHVLTAQSGPHVLELVAKNPNIACIVMDLGIAGMDGLKTTHALKSNFSTYHIPIILLTHKIAIEDMIDAVEEGADDYMKKPFEMNELLARLLMNIRRSERDQNANPLTKLPGNNSISRTILMRLSNSLAVLYADLDNFKAYNDKYGFSRGDSVIQYTAHTLSTVIKTIGNNEDFLGHIGGDDFVIISTPDKAEALAISICKEFDKGIQAFYNEEDRSNKKMTSYNRQGKIQEFPLVALSVAIITNEQRELESLPHIAQLATELKQFAKTKPDGALGSNYAKDRRKI